MEKYLYKWDSKRIDIYLSIEFWLSRNFFHHIIKRWWVLINWRIIKKSYNLKNWDEIIVDNLQRYYCNEILEDCPNINVEVVLEKDDYLVLFKEKWVLSHPSSVWDIKSPSIVWFLYHKYKNLPSIWNFIRAWLLHRLDKETDWYMIVAKTEKWLSYFKELFNMKSVAESIQAKELIKIKKIYKAKCLLSQKWKEFLVWIWDNLPFYIDEMVRPKIPWNNYCKLWISKIIDFSIDWDYVDIIVEILTWRTHQIRCHLSEKWLYIVWDKLYWIDKNNDDMMQLSNIYLEFEDCYWEMIKIWDY